MSQCRETTAGPSLAQPLRSTDDLVVPMTPDRRHSWMPWLRVAVPGAFVGYGAFLVSHSAILGVLAGLVVSIVCWVVLRPTVR